MSSTTGRPTAALRPKAVPDDFDCLAGSGEACALAQSIDWAETPLGPVAGWSQALRSAAALVLHNHSAMLLWWGPQFVQIYNDAYRPVLGDKHPRAMGQRFRDCWSEVFHILGPMAERPFRGGPASTSDDIAVPINRKVLREEAHFRLAYSPVPDNSVQATGIGGVLATVTEITEEAYAKRQIRTLRDLGARSAAQGMTAEQACVVAAATLGENPWDVPFALFYLLDDRGERARLAASAGFDERSLERAAPLEADLAATAHPGAWPILQVARQRQVAVVASLATPPEGLPASPWSDQPGSAIVLPLASPEQARVYGVLICGTSPHRVLDAGYRTFFELAAAQIVTAIRNARALQEERKHAKALAEIDRAKTAFFSNVSHEFRTPLTLILGPVEEASCNPSAAAPVRAQLDLVHRNALRLQKLVNSLLDFSRIEAGRVEASYEPSELGAMTRDLASTFRSAMDRAGLAFAVECDDLGEPVFVDAEMWEKIVLNLISNAFKFTLHGRVTVRLRREAADAVLEVTDTGVGVPEQELPRLFERFHRVESTAGRTREGSGIGLALVQELVKLHDGKISVASELGSGTTVRVTVPLGSAHLPAARIKAPRALASTAVGAQAFVQEALRWVPPSGGDTASALPPLVEEPIGDRPFERAAGARVLLADDNADMRSYVGGLLAPTFIVEAVADGEQALDAARRERPDLILSDIMMPRVDGLALLKALRADEQLCDIPVILLSARAGEEARVAGLDAGADDYLIKPFSARELLARVGARLELNRMRRENDEALREREEQLRLATEAAEVGLWDVDLVSETLFWPPRVKAMFGISADVPVSMADFYSGLHPEDRERTSEAFAAALDPKRRALYDVEYRTVGKEDGLLRWVAAKGRGVFGGGGRCVRVIGTAIDITARKRTEEALRRNAAWLNGQKEAFQAAVNGAALEVSLGILARTTTEQMEGEPRCAFFIAGAGGPELSHVGGMSEEYARRMEGFRCWSFPVETTAGKVVGTLAIYFPEAREPTVRDRELAAVMTQSAAIIVSRQQEAESLEKALRALKVSDRQKDEFLAMLAHELRNPLAPIGTATELLARTAPDDSRAQTAVGMIKRQVSQLTRLVDDLLDVSRITQGRIRLRKRPVDLAAAIAQAIETAEPQLREKRHELSVTVSSYEPLYVMGDFARLVQCAGNLLTNAVKYTEPGGRISIRSGADEGNVFIEVADSGTGIPAELLPRVFDLFVQSERSLDRAQGGLGIGLAVVKRLVEMHEGEVHARSEGPGRGSTFEIRLPRIAKPASLADAAAKFKAEPRRVLIVDDNADAANSLAMLLALQGHETQVAYGAEEALGCCESFMPEVGLLDIGLPEMNGYELAKRLRALPRTKGLRLFALTGYGQAQDRQRALAAGFDGHLVKPVDLVALERALAGIPSAGGRVP